MADAAHVLLWELWDSLKNRLSTERMARLTRGPGRVFVVDEVFPDLGETEVWGRVVIVPTDTLWDIVNVPNETRKVGFLIRTDAHAPSTEATFRAGRMLEAMQSEARSLLHGWTPPGPFEHIRVALPLYQWTAPQPLPLWDDEDGLYYLSSEYRTEGVNPNL